VQRTTALTAENSTFFGHRLRDTLDGFIPRRWNSWISPMTHPQCIWSIYSSSSVLPSSAGTDCVLLFPPLLVSTRLEPVCVGFASDIPCTCDSEVLLLIGGILAALPNDAGLWGPGTPNKEGLVPKSETLESWEFGLLIRIGLGRSLSADNLGTLSVEVVLAPNW
jgi:hypothetical protein